MSISFTNLAGRGETGLPLSRRGALLVANPSVFLQAHVRFVSVPHVDRSRGDRHRTGFVLRFDACGTTLDLLDPPSFSPARPYPRAIQAADALEKAQTPSRPTG